MDESWFELLRRRVHDGWVALVSSLKRHWKDWKDLDEKFPGVGGSMQRPAVGGGDIGAPRIDTRN